MSSDNMYAETTEQDRERVGVLTEHDPLAILENLPRTVFLTTLQVQLGRTTGTDRPYTDHEQANTLVEPRSPEPVPYIPLSTIYFDNPAERAPDGATMWTPADCAQSLTQLLDHLDEETHANTDQFTIQKARFAEIPPQYRTTDRGQHIASPALYKDNGEVTLAEFDRDASLSAHRVRNELEEALPRDTRTPLQLTELVEATAKQSRVGRGTTQKASRKRYFTEKDAERHNDLSVTPAVWKPSRISDAENDSRPLEPALTELDQFMPELTDSDFVATVTLTGETRLEERFYADDVLTQS